MDRNWPVARSAQSDLDGKLVIRRTFDPNVPIQPRAGTDLQLGDYYPTDSSSAQMISGHLSSDLVMVFHVVPDKKGESAASYTWVFGQSPRSPAK